MMAVQPFRLSWQPAARSPQGPRVGQPKALAQVEEPKAVPAWAKIGLGGAMVAVGLLSTFTKKPGRRAGRETSGWELAAASGSIIGGLWIALQGLGVQL
jgi:hypothetical protein